MADGGNDTFRSVQRGLPVSVSIHPAVAGITPPDSR